MDSESGSGDETDTQDVVEHGYAVGGQFEYEEEDEIPAYTGGEFYDPPILSPSHTFDVPSVRGPPPSVMTTANSISAHGRTLPPLRVVARELFHSGTRSVGLDVNLGGGREKKHMFGRRRTEEMTDREFEVKTFEIECEILEFKTKMKELTKAEGVAKGVRGQGVRWSSQEEYRASNSDREDGGRNQGDSRTGSGLRKVS